MRLSYSYSHILKVALPLMLGTFIQSLVMITDSAFLSRYSTLSFDASGNAGLIYVTLFVGLTGLADSSLIVMARRIGQNIREAINPVLQSSILVILIIALLFFFFLQFGMGDLLMGYSKSKELAQEQIDFLTIRSYGFFITIPMLVLNSFFLANGKTWVILLSTSTFAIANVILDYLLIFGFWNIDPMGVKGAALASTISEGIASLVLIVILFNSKERFRYQVFYRFHITKEALLGLLRVGFPLMIQGFVALSSWTVFFTFIEQMGLYELTVSQNIRFVYFLAFVPIFGFGATTRAYVAQYMDAKEITAIPIIIKRIQLLTFLFLLLFFHGALLYPETLISLINPDPTYIKDSAFILRLMFGSILIFGLTVPYFQTINGSGNTRASLAIETIATLTYIIYSYITIKVLGWSLVSIWTVEYLYFTLLGILSCSYLYFFNWRKKIY